jgi:hypothetical protein
MKSLRVVVSWNDRTGEPQSVTLSSIVAAADPALSGALSVAANASPVRRPLGRDPGVPPSATDLGNGRSAFKPPGDPSGMVVWVFDNLSGVIVGVCNTVTTGQAELSAADVASCSDNANGLALSGYVRFATGATQPTAAQAENPTSSALNLAIDLALTSTGHATPSHSCFAQAPTFAITTSTAVPYHCAVFFQSGTVPRWSGMSTLVPLAFVDPVDDVAWIIAGDAADNSASHYRVCRYTPATSDAQTIPNQLHPRAYSDVTALEPLTHQNFVVIRAGNGVLAFDCPADVPANPAVGDLVNSNTLLHQPPPPPE